MALTRAALGEALHGAAAGWSDNDFITAFHFCGSLLAVAGQQRAAIFRSDGLLSEAAASAPEVVTLCAKSENVTAAAWAAFSGESCLIIGTSAGWLQLHANSGTLLLRQQLHSFPVLSLHPRSSCMGVSTQEDASDMTIVFADAAARISGLEIQSLVRLQQRSWTDPDRLTPLGFTKWDLKSAGPRSDGLCIGTRPPTLQTLMRGGYIAPKLTIATVGSNPPLAAFEVEEHTQRGAIAMVADIASSLKGWIPSPMRRSKEVKLQVAELAMLSAEMRDDKTRCITSMLPAPKGVLAAATDTLGRVMLLDLAAMAIVRLWKGYRDAQCAWVTLTEGSLSSDSGETCGRSNSPSHKRAKQDVVDELPEAQLHLVIYAPRKGVCDVYACRHGPVVHSLQCGANCRLLQPSPALGPSSALKAGCSQSTDCLLLDFDTGSLTSLRQGMTKF